MAGKRGCQLKVFESEINLKWVVLNVWFVGIFYFQFIVQCVFFRALERSRSRNTEQEHEASGAKDSYLEQEWS